MAAPAIVWLRQDLRLHDQRAFAAAAADGPVLPVYILDDKAAGQWAIGGAQRWWLARSLQSLERTLSVVGLPLILRRGRAAHVLRALAEECGAERVHAVRHYEPWWRAAEAEAADAIDLVLHDGNQLVPPRDVTSGSGAPFRIYSAFWRRLSTMMPPPAPEPVPSGMRAPDRLPASDRLDAWGLLPTPPNWAREFEDAWTPGEAGAARRLEAFAGQVAGYERGRNMPSEEGTTSLSPHLHMGEVSPAQVWTAIAGDAAAEKFLKELAWRDFATGVIAANPDYGTIHARAQFDRLAWRRGADADHDFACWTRGETGYPIVDAGMRQLWRIGWMHNRVRMIAASFLVKHLLIDWRSGARWFWDTLVDADYGNNSVNWQWIAGTGSDANMFGRIMAPIGQSERFDAGAYIRRWVPELADLPDDLIHDPHSAGAAPPGYAPLLIGHREGRERALAASRAMRAVANPAPPES